MASAIAGSERMAASPLVTCEPVQASSGIEPCLGGQVFALPRLLSAQVPEDPRVKLAVESDDRPLGPSLGALEDELEPLSILHGEASVTRC